MAIAISAWTTAGIKAATNGDGTCSAFDYGDTTKCVVSRADAAFAFFTAFLFAITSYISVQILKQYRRTGDLPELSAKSTSMPTTDMMGKGAWSASVEEREDVSLDEPDLRHQYGQTTGDDTHGLLDKRASFSMEHSAEPSAHAPWPSHAQPQFAQAAPSNGLETVHNNVPKTLTPGPPREDHPAFRPPHQPPPPSQPADLPLINGTINFPSGNYERA